MAQAWSLNSVVNWTGSEWVLVCPPVFKTECDPAKGLGGFDSYTFPPTTYRSYSFLI